MGGEWFNEASLSSSSADRTISSLPWERREEERERSPFINPSAARTLPHCGLRGVDQPSVSVLFSFYLLRNLRCIEKQFCYTRIKLNEVYYT